MNPIDDTSERAFPLAVPKISTHSMLIARALQAFNDYISIVCFASIDSNNDIRSYDSRSVVLLTLCDICLAMTL